MKRWKIQSFHARPLRSTGPCPFPPLHPRCLGRGDFERRDVRDAMRYAFKGCVLRTSGPSVTHPLAWVLLKLKEQTFLVHLCFNYGQNTHTYFIFRIVKTYGVGRRYATHGTSTRLVQPAAGTILSESRVDWRGAGRRYPESSTESKGRKERKKERREEEEIPLKLFDSTLGTGMQLILNSPPFLTF